MTPEIAITLAIILIAVILFISERLRPDLIALLVLGGLVLTRLITPVEALSGFSSPAVVTVWAVFMLSAGLTRTGIANRIGHYILQLAGDGKIRLLLVIMLTAGFLSAFMNNIGVAALLLPVVMDIAHRTDQSPSKLLMPLAFACLLGGMTTLIGTPPNILVSNALIESGLQPFEFLDYTPVGLIVMTFGFLFIVLIGRFLLPARNLEKDTYSTSTSTKNQVFNLSEQLFIVNVPENSVLDGRTIAESKVGAALGLNVIGIIRLGRTMLSPDPDTKLHSGDRLLVTGALEHLQEIKVEESFIVQPEHLEITNLIIEKIDLTEVNLAPESEFLGKTLKQINFRQRFGGNVIAIVRQGSPIRSQLQYITLQEEDRLLVQSSQDQIDNLQTSPDLVVTTYGGVEITRLQESIFAVSITPDSSLVDKTLSESRFAETYGLNIVSIIRQGKPNFLPGLNDVLQAGDTLIVNGDINDVIMVQGLRELNVDQENRLKMINLETDKYGFVEAILSPQTKLDGKTLRQIHFRDKFGLNVLAIWRQGKVIKANLTDMALNFGDALLLHGQRNKLRVLASEPDFIVLTENVQESPRSNKALIAAIIMAGVILTALGGILPIVISAVIGATLMVLTGCLTMDEAYDSVNWKAIFLIAGMIPLGIAMQTSGTAEFLAQNVVLIAERLGPYGIIGALYIMTNLASQIMPNAVSTVLMAPIAINTAADLHVSPHTIMMAVAIAASASFLSPIGHPANVLVMGPGGYRFIDFVKLGVPLTIVVGIVVMVVLPLVWPLYP